MPWAIAAAIIAAVGATGAAAVAITVATYVAVTVAMSLAIGAITRAIMGGPKAPERPAFDSMAEQARGRTLMVRAVAEAHRVVYGEVMLSGPILFMAASGATNQYLHVLVALAGHELQEIGDVYLDDTISTDARFAGLLRINKHLGTDTQTADADLVAEVATWTASHRLQGIAYLYVRFLWSEEVWLNGLPNIKCKVKGRKVYDPRTGLTAYSNNAALCQRDYIRADFGIEADEAEVDEDLVATAANVCDEAVSIKSGTTQARYTCDGAFLLSERPIDVMDKLLTASGGTLVYAQGTYRLYAGAYDMPAMTLTADDLRGAVGLMSKPSRRDVFNAVRGTFVDEDAYYQANEFPPVVSSAYAAEDGATVYRDLELPFTINRRRAQRLAKLMLERGRRGMTVKFPAKLTAMRLSAWDTVYVTIEHLGWQDKVFRVLEWALTEDGGIDLTLQEEDWQAYGWAAEETEPGAVLETLTFPGPSERQATVSTRDIAANAVTQVLQAYSAGLEQTLIADDDAYHYVDTITQAITTTGGVVEIKAQARVLHTDAGSSTGLLNCTAELRRDTTNLAPQRDFNHGVGDWQWTIHTFTDTPAAGTYSYKLRLGFMKAAGSNDSYADVTKRHLQLAEWKR